MALIVMDRHGLITFANTRVERVFGYRPEELQGQPVEVLVPYASRDRHIEQREAFQAQSGARDMGAGPELRGLHRDGREFAVEVALSPISTDSGPMVVAAVVDISARKTAEAALAESEERFRQLAEHVRDVFWMVEWPSERLLYVNDRFQDTWGWPAADLQARPRLWLDAVHPEDRERIAARFAAEAAAGTFSCEYRIVARDGSVRHVRDRRFPVRNAAGDVYRLAGVAEDVTERKQTEARLQREKERAQIALASIGDAVITTDAEGRVESLNAVAVQTLGWSAARARGRDIGEVARVLHETTREPLENPVHTSLRERRITGFGCPALLVRPDGSELNIDDSAAPIFDGDGELVGSVMVFRDVTSQRQLAREVTWHATHDALTGLVNRREFERRLALMLAHVDGHTRPLAVCYLDLDHFKTVNDSCGHAAGDELLRQIAALIRTRIRDRDTAARLGGDEFGLLLGECPVEHAMRIAEDLRDRLLAFRFAWGDRSFRVGVSIGVIPITSRGSDLATVLGAADGACYAAKQMGGSRVHLPGAGGNPVRQRPLDLNVLALVQGALTGEGFRLYGQPIVPLQPAASRDGHVEVLLRLAVDGRDPLAAGAFLPAAERYHQMCAVDRWVLAAVLARQQVTADTGWRGEWAINLSAQSLGDETFPSFVIGRLGESGVDPHRLCFEFTETAAHTSPEATERFVRTVRERGCRVALDDFGSVLSSFAHLKGLPVDYVKIHGRLLCGMLDEPVDVATIEAIHRIARMLGIRTIAKSVESETVLERLRAMGIDFAQGFELAPPTPLKD